MTEDWGSHFYSINKYSIYENHTISKSNVPDIFKINLQVIFILLIIHVVKQLGALVSALLLK